MRAKEYLGQALNLDSEINRLLEEKQSIFDTLLSSPVTQSDKVQTSARNTTEETYMKLLKYGEKVDKKIDELVDLKIKISELISELSNQKHKLVLSKRYIELKSFEEIAVELNYDYSWVTRLHGEALVAVENSDTFKRLVRD